MKLKRLRIALLGAFTVFLSLFISYLLGFYLLSQDIYVNFERGDVWMTTLLGFMTGMLVALYVVFIYSIVRWVLEQ